MTRRKRHRIRPIKVDPENPWQFQVGQSAYVWGFDQEFTFIIAEQLRLGRLDFPHYVITGINGDQWTVPQLHLSREPIAPRK